MQFQFKNVCHSNVCVCVFVFCCVVFCSILSSALFVSLRRRLTSSGCCRRRRRSCCCCCFVLFVFVVDHDNINRQRSLLLNTPKTKKHWITSRTASNQHVLYARKFSSLKICIYRSVCSHAVCALLLLVFFFFRPRRRRRRWLFSSITLVGVRSFYQILHFINHIQHLPCTVSSAAHPLAFVAAFWWNQRISECVRACLCKCVCIYMYGMSVVVLSFFFFFVFSVRYSQFLVSKNT